MIIENIGLAFAEIANIKTLALMLIGVAGGLIAGAIPGFTIAMAVVLTLPFTFGMPPSQGLATMVSVLVGGLSGGLMAGILTGIPGTPSSVATTFDGFPMARKGEPGLALGLGVWSSFFGGILSAIVLVTLAPQLARIGLEVQSLGLFHAGDVRVDHHGEPFGAQYCQRPDRRGRRVAHQGPWAKTRPSAWPGSISAPTRCFRVSTSLPS